MRWTLTPEKGECGFEHGDLENSKQVILQVQIKIKNVKGVPYQYPQYPKCLFKIEKAKQ